ncbi:hypothetical protein HK102_004502 [Quaeritorhiza haematococci]|nr:hypothetical protein HK102_004502 [Quaeritorhiza haematococci]
MLTLLPPEIQVEVIAYLPQTDLHTLFRVNRPIASLARAQHVQNRIARNTVVQALVSHATHHPRTASSSSNNPQTATTAEHSSVLDSNDVDVKSNMEGFHAPLVRRLQAALVLIYEQPQVFVKLCLSIEAGPDDQHALDKPPDLLRVYDEHHVDVADVIRRYHGNFEAFPQSSTSALVLAAAGNQAGDLQITENESGFDDDDGELWNDQEIAEDFFQMTLFCWTLSVEGHSLEAEMCIRGCLRTLGYTGNLGIVKKDDDRAPWVAWRSTLQKGLDIFRMEAFARYLRRKKFLAKSCTLARYGVSDDEFRQACDEGNLITMALDLVGRFVADEDPHAPDVMRFPENLARTERWRLHSALEGVVYHKSFGSGAGPRTLYVSRVAFPFEQ